MDPSSSSSSTPPDSPQFQRIVNCSGWTDSSDEDERVEDSAANDVFGMLPTPRTLPEPQQGQDIDSPPPPADSPQFKRIVNYSVWSDSSDEDQPVEDSAAKDVLGMLPTPRTQEPVLPAPQQTESTQQDAVTAGKDADCDSSCDEETAVSSPAKRSRRYAMTEKDLPARIFQLLEQVKDFFTKPLNLKRFGPAISTTTHDKTRERIRCKYPLYYIHTKQLYGTKA